MAQQSRTPAHNIVILAAVTFALCGAVSALWELREVRRLRAGLAAQKISRLELLEILQESNAEIGRLTDLLDSARAIAASGRPAPARPEAASRRADGAAAAAAAQAAVSRRPPHPAPGTALTFDNGPVDRPLVALTFDGGAHDNAAADILDTLRSRGVRATMFITGGFVHRYPGLVRRIAAEGHVIGNHTDTHPHLTSWAQDRTHATLPGITPAFVCGELHTADGRMRGLLGRGYDPLWRAPYGETNSRINAWARDCGFIHVGWKRGPTWRRNLDSNDWVEGAADPAYRTPQEVLDKIMGLAAEGPSGINGGIILMHLGTVRNNPGQQVHRVIGTLIDRLRQKGYRFVTVTEMMGEAQ